MEMANGFSELTDANEQRRRFEEASEQARAKKLGTLCHAGKISASLCNTLPEAAGIALGIDRMMMILADTVQIDDIIAFPPEAL